MYMILWMEKLRYCGEKTMKKSVSEKNKKALAVIGASYLQVPLIEKAKSMGYTTHVFAWAAQDVGEADAPAQEAQGIVGGCDLAADSGHFLLAYGELGAGGLAVNEAHVLFFQLQVFLVVFLAVLEETAARGKEPPGKAQRQGAKLLLLFLHGVAQTEFLPYKINAGSLPRLIPRPSGSRAANR